MPKTVEQGFEAFLTELKPSKSEYDKAASHKNSVSESLQKNFSCYKFFETGSFGARTGIRHYSDADFFAAIPSEKLYTNSSTSLRVIKESLQQRFSSTPNIIVNCPSVRIPFGIYASETMEITPCCFDGLVETPCGKFERWEIPNCHEGDWMYSSPAAHNAYVNRENDRLSEKVKPLIQLVKAWKYYNSVPISSFYLELRVTKYCQSEPAIVYDIDLQNFFESLKENNLAKMRDPMGISGLIPACSSDSKKEEALSKINTGLTRIIKAREAENVGNTNSAFNWWDIFFGYSFPSR